MNHRALFHAMKFLDYRYHLGKRGPRPIAFRLAARIHNLIRARLYNHILRTHFMPAMAADRAKWKPLTDWAAARPKADVGGRFIVWPVKYGRSDKPPSCFP